MTKIHPTYMWHAVTQSCTNASVCSLRPRVLELEWPPVANADQMTPW